MYKELDVDHPQTPSMGTFDLLEVLVINHLQNHHWFVILRLRE